MSKQANGVQENQIAARLDTPPWENPEARRVLDSMTEYFVALNDSYDIVFVNRALAEAGGSLTESLVGKNHWELWPEMRGTVVEEAYSRAFATGLPARFEYFSARAGVWIDVNAYPTGGCLHVYFRDVTIEKREAADHAKAEEHYRSIVDALPQIAWVADVDGTASYFNARWYEYTGLDPSQIYETSSVVHPEDLKTTLERRATAYSHGQTYQTEVRLRRKDGEYRWHLTRAEPIRDSEGRAIRFVGTSTDVHNERLATHALREAEESLRLMTDSVPVLVAFVDRELRYRFVNRMFEEWFAVERDKVLGQHLRDFLGEAAFERLEPLTMRALNGEKLTFEWWVDYPTGRRFVSVTYVPRRAPNGEIDGFYVLSNDFTDRKRSEEALLASEQRFRAFVQAIPQIAWSAGVDGAIEFFNDRFYEYTGLPPSTGLGWSWAEILHPEDLEGARTTWLRSIKSGADAQVDFRIRSADGSYRWFLTRSVPVRDGEGNIARWFGTATDIEDQKAHSDALRFMFELANATRDRRDPEEIMSVTARLLGQHLGASRCAYCEVGEDETTLVNLHDWTNGIPSIAGRLQLSQFGSSIVDPLREGTTLVVSDVEHEASGADREALLEVQIRSMIASPLVKEGRLVAIMAVHSDVPRRWTDEQVNLVRLVVERCSAEIERARAERGLRQSEARLRQILEAATVGVIVNDRLGTFSYANPPLLSMLGYTREDLEQGRLNWRLIQAPDRVEHDDVALDQLRMTGSCEPYESELIASDGRRVPVYMGAAYITDEHGEGLTGAAFVTDLTPLKAAQRELEELNRELDQRVRDRTAELRASNETLEAYSYHVAHDLRAPLRAVVSTSRLIEEDFGTNLPEDARGLLRRQVGAANKLARLIDDLLRISRLPREQMERQPLDLTLLAEEVAGEARSAHPQSSTAIEVQPGMRAQADPRLLRLALLNLVENAVKYSPQGGLVKVGQRSDSVFFVSDEGIGIDMAYAQKIFEPFQRLHRDEDFPGTGIGLSNVSQIVTRHGGRVWLESEPGKGSTFYFTLG